MKRSFSLAMCLLLVATAGTVWAAGSTSGPGSRDFSGYDIAVYSPELVLHGGSAAGLGKASVDSFYIYGGPADTDAYGGSGKAGDGWIDGKFQNAQLQPATQGPSGLPADGWFGADLTEAAPFWQLSTFNSPTGTQAIWSGQSAAQQPGWVSGAGYGNNWNDWIDYRQTVANAANPTTVTWTFTYNHDTEPSYDYFRAQYDSAGTMVDIIALDRTNKDSNGVFTPVNANLSVTLATTDYVGGGNEVHLRFRTDSDGGWSDEDGLWPTVGAVQIDNVGVDFGANGVATADDFDAGFGNWTPTPSDFAGDFAKVFPVINDVDPCNDNTTPQVGFIDDNRAPSNSASTTGGSVSASNGYGVAGGFVVNFTGGLTGGASPINNTVRSPVIDYDLDGTADDAADGVMLLAFDRWTHLPLSNGLFYIWNVRSTSDPAGLTDWTGWLNNNFVYYGGGTPVYGRTSQNVAKFIENFATLEKVQIELGLTDLADLFAFPGNDATPSPTFDNVSLQKAAAPGPSLSTRAIDLFMDSFSNGGTAASFYDGAGPNDESDFAIRIDRSSAINGAGTLPLAGDSISIDVLPVVPGSNLAGFPVLKYTLFANPAFDGVRAGLPAAAGTTADGWNWHTGTITGDSTRTSTGAVVADRFAFDVPFDGKFDRNATLLNDPAEDNGFYPGDWFFYYVEATDAPFGNITTIPLGAGGGAPPNNFPAPTGATTMQDIAKSIYNRNWRIRGLPTIDSNGDHPNILFVNDAFGFGNQPEWNTSFQQNGLFEGEDYDDFTVMGPSSGVDNGIGSAGVHGATADQLFGYGTLLYDGGGLSSILLSDGTGATVATDRGDDQGVLTAWHGQSADRYAFYWGDYLSSFLAANGVNYLQNILAIQLGSGGANVRPNIGNQTAPVVAPTGEGTSAGLFSASFVAFGGCPGINQFDDIQPLSGSQAVRSHEFVDPLAVGYAAAASVWHDRMEGGFRKVDMTFPYGFNNMYDFPGNVTAAAPDGRSIRAVFLAENVQAAGNSTNPLQATDTPGAQGRYQLSQNQPNPFNPKTNIFFSAPARGHVTLKVYNLRGQLVRTLMDEVKDAGEYSVPFDGRDNRGASLSSGIYLYELEAAGERDVKKMALVK